MRLVTFCRLFTITTILFLGMIATFQIKKLKEVMEDKAIQLIKTRITRLDAPDFDLEAWKSGTIAVLKRFMNHADTRITDIDQLKIDYSSWALRDSNSKYNPIETCKKKGKSILEAIVDEIALMGLEELSPTSTDPFELLSKKISDLDAEKLKDPGSRGSILKGLKKEDLVRIIDELLSLPDDAAK